jgi:hypothetical protein
MVVSVIPSRLPVLRSGVCVYCRVHKTTANRGKQWLQAVWWGWGLGPANTDAVHTDVYWKLPLRKLNSAGRASKRWPAAQSQGIRLSISKSSKLSQCERAPLSTDALVKLWKFGKSRRIPWLCGRPYVHLIHISNFCPWVSTVLDIDGF